MVLIIHGMSLDRRTQVRPVLGQFLVRERLRTGYELSCIRIDITPLSETVLDGHDLLVIPVCPEGAEDPAMIGHVAVPIGGSLPGDHGRKMRRLQRSHV